MKPATQTDSRAMLEAAGLYKSFGGLQVISNLSFSLEQGQILGLIGPNGSGKTTLFNLLTGFLKPDSGKARFECRTITNKRPYRICSLGITRTFQVVRPFPKLTTLENVTAGRSFGAAPARTLIQARGEAKEIIDFVRLGPKQETLAEKLTLLDRKRLEIARALATRPKLLLLDEVFAGLNPAEIEAALELVTRIKNLGISLMIVEHLMRVILGVCNSVVVLNFGRKIYEGAPQGAVKDQAVIKAYLGEDFRA